VKSFGDAPELMALDKASGDVVARVPLPKLGVPQGGGVPMTYMHEGKQYIVMAMGGADKPAELVAVSIK
jgi:quinoprotein glucose dehydrogenase